MDEREFLKGPLKRFLDDRGPRPSAPLSANSTDDEGSAGRPGATGRERRRHTRFRVTPMYSQIHVRRETATVDADGQALPPGSAGDPPPVLDGHLYDISVGGVRFELDVPLDDGERVTVEIVLPGCQKLIQASGKVVRINDSDDDPGPRRMALRFDRFADEESRQALVRYLGEGWLEQERAA